VLAPRVLAPRVLAPRVLAPQGWGRGGCWRMKATTVTPDSYVTDLGWGQQVNVAL